MTFGTVQKTVLLCVVLVISWCHVTSGATNTTTTTAKTTTNSTTGKTSSKCEDPLKQLSNCLDNIRPILTKASQMGMPQSEKDVDMQCNAFKTGMACVNDFSKSCSNATVKRFLEDQTTGARNMFKFLCDDPQFKKEYLKYVPCYKIISGDWDSCASKFNELVVDEMKRSNASDDHHRQVELCCSQFGFVRCVHKTALTKCRKDDASFLKHIAETLSNNHVHTTRCRAFDTRVCTSSGRRHAAVSALVALGVLAAVKYV